MVEILSQAFLELFKHNQDIKDKFVNFRDFSVEDLQKKGDPKKGEGNWSKHGACAVKTNYFRCHSNILILSVERLLFHKLKVLFC